MAKETKFKADRSTTDMWLNKYIGEEMGKQDTPIAFATRQLEKLFGVEIHAQIDGFCKFAEESKDITKYGIMSTLFHDLGGALSNDKWMLPRVSGYAEHSK